MKVGRWRQHRIGRARSDAHQAWAFLFDPDASLFGLLAIIFTTNTLWNEMAHQNHNKLTNGTLETLLFHVTACVFFPQHQRCITQWASWPSALIT
jgi:hypothetical protein